ncbi:MAG: ATP-dependent helicase HrpB [Steroidobacteraceae bacterium]
MRNEAAGVGPGRQHPLAVALRAAFGRHRDAVLQAPTGAGKSTLVPLALLQEDFVDGGKILMLEPRRLAARAVAGRMASLLGERIGDTVGYRMRLDTRVSRATRIEVVTEGVLTRLLQEDPALEQVACLIFDEYHERSLAADLGLAFALDARRELGAAFRVLIMSATLDGERVSMLLGDAEVVSVPGRAFPVELRYLGRALPLLPRAVGSSGGAFAAADSLERVVTSGVRRALTESAGDVLVFLPGAGEIRRVEALLLEAGLPADVQVLPLYGDMSAAAQDAVLAPAATGSRKVVLATNIAETSLTIPGVTAVVDSGLVRRSHFDPATGMSRLEVARISRAASEQRAGRAGRVAPGICYRLWSEGAHASLAPATIPEILEADLAPLALELARWGTDDAARLQWLDAPPAATLQQARELLARLDALNAHGRMTAVGRDMARLPVHPRLAHMLLAARSLDAVELAAQLSALLSERDVLRRGVGGAPHDPDIRSRLELLRGELTGEDANRNLLERVRRGAQSLAAAARALPGAPPVSRKPALPMELAGALLALAFPDRIGQHREGSDGRYLLANGRGAAFSCQVSLAREEFIVAVELDDREREARIDLAAPLTRALLEQLFASHIVTEARFGWEPREGAVLARRVRRLDALLLEDAQRPVADDERAVAAMLEGVRQLGIQALPWDAESRGLQARLEFVRALHRHDLSDWPASDDAALTASLEQWLVPHLAGITRREHLARVPLAEALRGRLGGGQLRALEALAPRELVVPTGSHIRIDYADANAPCISVRLQEVFGLIETPRIADGAVPVTFKLLSPAQRPVQITRDLAGFWRSSYVAVRKDMRGRYPRHHWPDNPLETPPTRGAKRKLGKGPRK